MKGGPAKPAPRIFRVFLAVLPRFVNYDMISRPKTIPSRRLTFAIRGNDENSAKFRHRAADHSFKNNRGRRAVLDRQAEKSHQSGASSTSPAPSPRGRSTSAVRVSNEGWKGAAFLNFGNVSGGNRYSRPRAPSVRFVAIRTPTNPANPGSAGTREERNGENASEVKSAEQEATLRRCSLFQ